MQNLEKNIADIRNEYKLKHLSENEALKDPFAQFQLWLNEALKSNLYEPTAMTLATVSPEGKPSWRTILMWP
jgi:pyridoxamine 5'-phosphate oxidase